MLQMNLCNSGRAGCYTGRAVPRAADVIAAEAPDVVTLNEICRDDGEAGATLRAARAGGTVVSAFQAAGDRPPAVPPRCNNGEPYGIGLLTRFVGRDARSSVHRGTYPAQDLADPEERVWLCVRGDGLHACTTHLANTSGRVALAQCAGSCSARGAGDPGGAGARRRSSAVTSTCAPVARRTCARAAGRLTGGSTTVPGSRSWRPAA
ncbi:hypothetical protein V2I01_43265 [Micromonospora sp. BRA006-A]|nr:hypothetical protein [Micromonospora sp. BRA006-A]